MFSRVIKTKLILTLCLLAVSTASGKALADTSTTDKVSVDVSTSLPKVKNLDPDVCNYQIVSTNGKALGTIDPSLIYIKRIEPSGCGVFQVSGDPDDIIGSLIVVYPISSLK